MRTHKGTVFCTISSALCCPNPAARRRRSVRPGTFVASLCDFQVHGGPTEGVHVGVTRQSRALTGGRLSSTSKTFTVIHRRWPGLVNARTGREQEAELALNLQSSMAALLIYSKNMQGKVPSPRQQLHSKRVGFIGRIPHKILIVRSCNALLLCRLKPEC